MTTLGLIGSGHIGSQLARVAAASGYDVILSNSRGPESLHGLVHEIGERATAGTTQDAATADLVVVTIPLAAVPDLPADLLDGRVVIDTTNYYPQRDGDIAELDTEELTTSQFVQRHFAGAHVVKAFNHIYARDITADASPAGSPGRRALIVASDDAQAKARVAAFIDSIGFEPYDMGDLADSWRIQRDTPAYGPRLTTEQLTEKLAAAKRYRDM
ncbi:hypothetical protein SAMN04489806_1516 [Paramicrobacterium humi]|uniref:Pyrroline-5-carboxylate reductase catalytic N-terminal domain-containing protein n=1 Tax=Paramicrobacterium humi TaxID=640635 RepID=A0A1H4LEB5_9MICO|nr:NADPH-dependent F420 reductase [Microbacterium humi]SEB69004.1 hypothetical protein SAMN04489806_1516 [Microbacterium humi]